MRKSFVYILTNAFGTVLYVGISSAGLVRVDQHSNGLGELHQRLSRLLDFEVDGDVPQAIAPEKQIKGWRRSKEGGAHSNDQPAAGGPE